MPDLFRFLRRHRHDDGGLTCRELVELVTDYLEGALSPEDRSRFEAHIAGCDGCHTYVQQMRKTLALLGALTPDSISPRAERDLRAAFRDWRAGSAS
jgi:anti-sigma factor RsiW